MMTRQLDKKTQKSGTDLFPSFNIYILGRVFNFDSHYADSEAIIAEKIIQPERYASLTQLSPYKAELLLKLDAKKANLKMLQGKIIMYFSY
jgi:hypothetical protein